MDLLLGTDLVLVERIRKAIERTPRFKFRIFTPQEIAYCEQRSNPYPSYAARFAVKEAFRKLHPELARGTRFKEVELQPGRMGRPYLMLSGSAEEKRRELRIGLLDVSIAHDGQYAMAVMAAVIGNEGGCR